MFSHLHSAQTNQLVCVHLSKGRVNCNVPSLTESFQRCKYLKLKKELMRWRMKDKVASSS